MKLFLPSGLAGAHLIRLMGNHKYPATARDVVEWMKSMQRTSLKQTCIFHSVMNFLKV